MSKLPIFCVFGRFTYIICTKMDGGLSLGQIMLDLLNWIFTRHQGIHNLTERFCNYMDCIFAYLDM